MRRNWPSGRCSHSTTSIASLRRCGRSCVRISELVGRRVALWGWGREGRAAWGALRDSGLGTRDSGGGMGLFCNASEAVEALKLDPGLVIEGEATAERLAAYEAIVKSPGISPYKPEAVAAAAAGTRFVGGTALWFGERAGAGGVVPGSICVTGTKG